MSLSVIELTKKLRKLSLKDNKYYLFIQLIDGSLLQKPSEDGFLGVVFPVGVCDSKEDAEKLQIDLSVNLKVAVCIIGPGAYLKIYTTLPESSCVKYEYDFSKGIEEIKDEVRTQKERNKKIRESVEGSGKAFQIKITEIEKKIEEVNRNLHLEEKDKHILKFYYLKELQELKAKVKNLDIENEVIERNDKNSLSFLINWIYTYSSMKNILDEAERNIVSHFETNPENRNLWQEEAKKRFESRGEGHLYDEIIKNFPSTF